MPPREVMPFANAAPSSMHCAPHHGCKTCRQSRQGTGGSPDSAAIAGVAATSWTGMDGIVYARGCL